MAWSGIPRLPLRLIGTPFASSGVTEGQGSLKPG
jgi:hypothetical protein